MVRISAGATAADTANEIAKRYAFLELDETSRKIEHYTHIML